MVFFGKTRRGTMRHRHVAPARITQAGRAARQIGTRSAHLFVNPPFPKTSQPRCPRGRSSSSKFQIFCYNPRRGAGGAREIPSRLTKAPHRDQGRKGRVVSGGGRGGRSRLGALFSPPLSMVPRRSSLATVISAAGSGPGILFLFFPRLDCGFFVLLTIAQTRCFLFTSSPTPPPPRVHAFNLTARTWSE